MERHLFGCSDGMDCNLLMLNEDMDSTDSTECSELEDASTVGKLKGEMFAVENSRREMVLELLLTEEELPQYTLQSTKVEPRKSAVIRKHLNRFHWKHSFVWNELPERYCFRCGQRSGEVIYKPSSAQNRDGTVQLHAVNTEPRKNTMAPIIFKRFFEGSQQPLAPNDESFSSVVPISPPRSNTDSPVPGTGRTLKQQRDSSASETDEEKLALRKSPESVISEPRAVSIGGTSELGPRPQPPPQMMMPGMNFPGGYNPVLNTTLGTIQEERIQDPGDFVIKYYASITDIFWCFWSLLTYLAHIGFDIWVALLLLANGDYVHFALTLAFITVPAVIMAVLSLVFYIRDWKVIGDKQSPIRWMSRSLFLTCLLAPLLRIIDGFLFGCRSRMTKDTSLQKRLYDRMADEEVDCLLLRMFEAFLQAGPQTVLQLYLLTTFGSQADSLLITAQCVSVGTSLVCMASIMVAFQKSLRLSQPDKALLTRPGMVFMFVWRFLTISSRVLALAVFAAKFTYFVAIVVAVHFAVMLWWVFMQDTNYCMLANKQGMETHSPFLEFLFRVVAAFVQIFDFFNLLEGRTRLRGLVYYVLVFVENMSIVVICYITASVSGTPMWYDSPVVLYVIVGFLSGILIQVFYYKCCHPNNFNMMYEDRRVPWCVKYKDIYMCRAVEWDLGELDNLDDDVEEAEKEKEKLTAAPKPMPRKRAPPTQYLRGAGQRNSSTSTDSNRSNFIHESEMNDNMRAKLNLQYRTPEKLDDIVKPNGHDTTV